MHTLLYNSLSSNNGHTHRRLTVKMRPTRRLLLLTTFLSLMFVNTTTMEKCSADCCKLSRNNSVATCKNHGHRLTYIPRLPCQVTKLEFTNNYLPNVTRDTFRNLTCQNITTLKISSNNISFLSEDVFSPFEFLLYLDISNNGNLSIQTFQNAASSLSDSHLEELVLYGMGWKSFPVDVFLTGRYDSMRLLDLSRNALEYFSDAAIRTLPALTKLDLSDNKIVHMRMNGHETLKIMIVRRNRLFGIPDFCSGHVSSFPSLTNLTFSENYIQQLNRTRWHCLKNLRNLGLFKNEIKQVPTNAFSPLESLEHLNLAENKIVYLQRYAFNNSHLRKLSIQNKKMDLKRIKTKDLSTIFNSTKYLIMLDLTGASFRQLNNSHLIPLLSPLRKLEDLRLAACEIRKLTPGVLSSFPNLTNLDLSGNSIVSFTDPNPFAGVYNLEKLNLRGNNIHQITEDTFPAHLRKSVKSIDLAYNPFSCDCSSIWFKSWLKSRTHIFKRYPKDYKCSTPYEIRGTVLADYNPSLITCTITQPVLNVIIILSSFVMLMAFVGVLGYRYRWNIRLWIFLCRSKRTEYQRIPGSEEVLYDAIIASAEEDRPWVIDILAVYLESRCYKLYISDRDCSPTEQEAAKWINSLRNSNKIIFVLSPSFLSSHFWAYLTQVAIHEAAMRGTETDHFVPLYKEKTTLKHMKRSMLEILTKIRPPEWTTDRTGQELFWRKLLAAVGKPQHTSAMPTNGENLG